MNVVALADVKPTPWKNGGGTTRELLAWPQAQDWRVRISVAEVAADGPFSAYPGVERWFAVLSGAGVRLRVGQALHRLDENSGPLRFAGADPVHCELIGGATQDFNLMLRGATGTLERVSGSCERRLDAPCLIAVYARAERAAARFGSEERQVAPASLAWQILEQPTAVRLQAADALWMEIAL